MDIGKEKESIKQFMDRLTDEELKDMLEECGNGEILPTPACHGERIKTCI